MNIEYIPESHTYLVDGVITPSVTQIIHRMMPGMYNGVPAAVLKAAAGYGDRVHEAIEMLCDGKEPEYQDKSYEGMAIRRFQRLQNYRQMEIASWEQTVAYMDGDTPLFAGRYDLLGTVLGIPAIIDIKTTQKYNPAYLEVQLSMYKMAIDQAMESAEIGTSVRRAYCLWLPKKHLGDLIEVKLRRPEELLPEIRKAVQEINEEIQKSF